MPTHPGGSSREPQSPGVGSPGHERVGRAFYACQGRQGLKGRAGAPARPASLCGIPVTVKEPSNSGCAPAQEAGWTSCGHHTIAPKSRARAPGGKTAHRRREPGGIFEKLAGAKTANGMRAKTAPKVAEKTLLEFRGEVQETAMRTTGQVGRRRTGPSAHSRACSPLLEDSCQARRLRFVSLGDTNRAGSLRAAGLPRRSRLPATTEPSDKRCAPPR